MHPSIFISYRRSDAGGYVSELNRRLEGEFDEDTVFFDRRKIAPGAKFPEQLRTAVIEASVALIVIGPDWDTLDPDTKTRRIDDDKSDWVHEEIRLALDSRPERERLVIPILVGGVIKPRSKDWPIALRPLWKNNELVLTGAGPVWEESFQLLVRRLDEKTGISPEERERDWVYDSIAQHLAPLNEKQRRLIAEKLAKLDGGPATAAFSARALAKRFYHFGPQALESVNQAFENDDTLLRILKRLKDYWVKSDEAKKLAAAWTAPESYRAAIVQGRTPRFTPECVVQKATNEMTPWRIKSIVSSVSQPSATAIVSDIHAWLRRNVFAQDLHERQLADREEPVVTQLLKEKLSEWARENQPLAVQLDQVAAADDSVVAAIRETFPHLRLLILVPEQGMRDLTQKFEKEIADNATIVVTPEVKPGDEGRAFESYNKIARKFHAS